MSPYLLTFARYLMVPIVLLLLGIGLYKILRFFGVKEKTAMGYVLILPWLVGFVVFNIYPVFGSLILSFTNYDLFNPPRWIGIDNYLNIFENSIDFWPSLKLTLLYSLFSVPIGVIGSLMIALLLNMNLKGIGIYRTIYYLPAILPEVSVALLWRWLFNSESGLANYMAMPILKVIGISKPDWFGDSKLVLPAFIIMSVWGIFGTNMVVFLASLKGVSKELYEASELDGANGWNRLINITIPMISPVIFMQTIMGMIGALQIFTVAMFVRPTSAAGQFMNMLIYQKGFQQFRMGEASALAWILFLIILGFTLLVFKSSPIWVYYESEVKR